MTDLDVAKLLANVLSTVGADKLDKAFREACIVAGLKGESGGEPSSKHLEYEIRTLTPKNKRAFINTLLSVAFSD